MKRTEMEPITRTYCDVCGKEITHSIQYIERNDNVENHYCTAHNPRNFADVVKEHAIDLIKRQPHMVPNA